MSAAVTSLDAASASRPHLTRRAYRPFGHSAEPRPHQFAAVTSMRDDRGWFVFVLKPESSGGWVTTLYGPEATRRSALLAFRALRRGSAS